MVINILDYTESTSTYEDGEKIYNLIHQALKNNEQVILSFNGISSVPSSFINSALIRLIEDFSFETIRSKIAIINSTKNINELIKSRFAFVNTKK